MKAPIVQHLCKGFMLRFLWGQGNAESQLTAQQGRVKLCSFDSPRFGEPICLVQPQQPVKQYSVRIPRQESSLYTEPAEQLFLKVMLSFLGDFQMVKRKLNEMGLGMTEAPWRIEKMDIGIWG